MSNISLIDGHIDNAEHCVSCGAVIPEGRQVCIICGLKTKADGFDGMARFMVDDIDDGLQNYNGFWHLVEVIGNIHDNPELLKECEGK